MHRHLKLLPLTQEHAGATFRWVQTREVIDGIGLRDPHPTLDKTRAWIQKASKDPGICAWAIYWDTQHVGNVVLDQIDGFLQSARLSVYLGEQRGQGRGRAAIAEAVRRGFDELGLHKIWLTVHAENIRAITAYLGVGFQLEGIHRQEFILGGRRVAALYMGLLRDDFLQGLTRDEVTS